MQSAHKTDEYIHKAKNTYPVKKLRIIIRFLKKKTLFKWKKYLEMLY